MSTSSTGSSGPGASGPGPDFGRSGSSPVRSGQPRKRPWWVLALLAVILIAVLLLSLAQCGAFSTRAPAAAPGAAASAGAAATTADVAAAGAGAAATGAEKTVAGAAPATAATGPAGPLTVAGAALLPVSSVADATGSLAAQVGKPATAAGVTVQSVPADEGFWVGTSDTDRVWVQLTGGPGESPYTVKPGDKVDFTGQVVAHDAGFAAQVGVDAAEGADQLTSQKAHIEVPKNVLKLSTS